MNIVIDFTDEQDKIDFTEEYELLCKKVIEKTLECEFFDNDACVFVTLTDNENIRLINNEQRGIDRETDVLSFPVLEFEDGKMLDCVGDYYEDKLILGDIVLSLEKAGEQSIEYGHSFEREMCYLICHSVLHLLGYDHETEEEREQMRSKEEKTLELLSLTR